MTQRGSKQGSLESGLGCKSSSEDREDTYLLKASGISAAAQPRYGVGLSNDDITTNKDGIDNRNHSSSIESNEHGSNNDVGFRRIRIAISLLLCLVALLGYVTLYPSQMNNASLGGLHKFPLSLLQFQSTLPNPTTEPSTHITNLDKSPTGVSGIEDNAPTTNIAVNSNSPINSILSTSSAPTLVTISNSGNPTVMPSTLGTASSPSSVVDKSSSFTPTSLDTVSTPSSSSSSISPSSIDVRSPSSPSSPSSSSSPSMLVTQSPISTTITTTSTSAPTSAGTKNAPSVTTSTTFSPSPSPTFISTPLPSPGSGGEATYPPSPKSIMVVPTTQSPTYGFSIEDMTDAPSPMPTNEPSEKPTFEPTLEPTAPTFEPSPGPTYAPGEPTPLPTVADTPAPSVASLEIAFKRDGYSMLVLDNDLLYYEFLKNKYVAVMEPYAPMIPVLADLTSDVRYYNFSMCFESETDVDKYTDCTNGTITLDNIPTVYVECDPFDKIYITLVEYQTSTNDFIRSSNGYAICMYVRREIRELTESDLAATMDAMHKMWEYSEDEGQAIYGDKFHESDYFVRFHYFNAAWQDADHIHEGNGFMSQHIKITNMFEESMQAVDPSVTIPFWDFTIDSANGTAIYDSFIMTADTFGSMKLPKDPSIGFTFADDSALDGAIQDGRWAYTPVNSYNMFDDLRTGYSFLRAPWNQNPSPYLSRFASAMDISLPDCGSHYQAVQQTDLTTFTQTIEAGPHAKTHVRLGGTFGCDLLLPLYEQGLIKDYTSFTDMCGNWVFTLKEFYRNNYLIPMSDCSIDEDNVDDSVCGFTCNDPDDTFISEIISKLITSMSPNMTRADWESVKEFICEGDGQKIFYGEHLECASPSDPSFWVIHPTLERLFHAKLMSGGFATNTWPTNPMTEYVCDKPTCYDSTVGAFTNSSECCVGHFEYSQMYDAVTGDRSNFVGLTNGEVLTKTDPTSNDYSMTYIYADFDWSHCYEADHLTNFDALFLSMSQIYTKDPTSTPTSRPSISLAPTAPTIEPTIGPSYEPTIKPTPTPKPTPIPPTEKPSTTLAPTPGRPTFHPTAPSGVPTAKPTPTVAPTPEKPTAVADTPTSIDVSDTTVSPTFAPSPSPSSQGDVPSAKPSHGKPTTTSDVDTTYSPSSLEPTFTPSYIPTLVPTASPSLPLEPTTSEPTTYILHPTNQPVFVPTYAPTETLETPTHAPTKSSPFKDIAPTKKPTASPESDGTPSIDDAYYEKTGEPTDKPSGHSKKSSRKSSSSSSSTSHKKNKKSKHDK